MLHGKYKEIRISRSHHINKVYIYKLYITGYYSSWKKTKNILAEQPEDTLTNELFQQNVYCQNDGNEYTQEEEYNILCEGNATSLVRQY